jgi:hypothetical protein
MKFEDIRARVKFNWSNKNCKFLPGQKVFVFAPKLKSEAVRDIRAGRKPMYSRNYLKHIGKKGTVMAVSCADDGKIRGRSANGYFPRAFTRYYVEFDNGDCVGYHSHHLISEQAYKDKKSKNGFVKV